MAGNWTLKGGGRGWWPLINQTNQSINQNVDAITLRLNANYIANELNRSL